MAAKRGSVAFLEAAVNIALDVPVEEVKLQVAQKVDKRRSILMGRHVKRHNPKMRDHSLKDVTLVTSPRPSVQKEKRALAPKLAAAAQSSPAMLRGTISERTVSVSSRSSSSSLERSTDTERFLT